MLPDLLLEGSRANQWRGTPKLPCTLCVKAASTGFENAFCIADRAGKVIVTMYAELALP